MKYYPARSLGIYPTVHAALRSKRFTEEQAEFIINNAKLNRSESVFVPCNRVFGFLTTTLPDGSVALWQACISSLCDSPREAKKRAKALKDRLERLGHPESDWTVLEYRPPVTRSLH